LPSAILTMSGVGHPVGRRDDDFVVARIEQRQRQVEEALLAAAGNQDLVALVFQAIVALELGDNGVLEFRRPVHGRVLGLAGINRGHGGILDVPGGVEIRLTGAKADNVLARRPQFSGLAGDGEGG